jgi:restriction endonuclease S subunit
MRETGSVITALYLNGLLYSNRSLFSIFITDKRFDTKFVLGCSNSKVLQFYYRTKFKAETNLFPKIRIIQAKKLPIPNVPLPQQQPIITLIEQILSAKQQNTQADITVLEKEIDKLMYELYGLTAKEIAIIEQK